MKFFNDIKHLFDKDALKSYDWRALKKYTSPRAAEDLNTFLETIPRHVSKSMLVAAGIAWAVAGVLGLYTTIQLQKLTELKATFQEDQALRPVVPKVENLAVRSEGLKKFIEGIETMYNGLSIKVQGSNIVLQATALSSYGQFRDAIGHIMNGRTNWRVDVDSLCIGRECDRFPLSVTLKVGKVSVSNPN